jgi:hypothetical protein
MRTKYYFVPEDINNVIEYHNLDAKVVNENYLYINAIAGDYTSWLDVLIKRFNLGNADRVSMYYNGCDRCYYIVGYKNNGRSRQKVAEVFFTEDLLDVAESLKHARVHTRHYDY